MVRDERSIPIQAADGFSIAATLFEPTTAAPGSTVLIHGATAAPQSYYRAFAGYLADHGHRVVTYDYRGVGQSRPESLRAFSATMTDWAMLDAAAVIDHVRDAHPGPLVSIGHSFGGQLLGILDEAQEVDGAILVASQLGSVRHWPLPQRLHLRSLWWAAVPALTWAYGYLPGSAGLGGVDLPAGVAREWARWCRSRDYLLDHVEGARERFARLRAPTIAYSFTDDDYAPALAVDALLAQLSGTAVEHRRLAPAALGVPRIGHFGAFRDAMANTLWPELRAAITELASGGAAMPRPGRAEATPEAHPTALFEVSPAEVMRDLSYGR